MASLPTVLGIVFIVGLLGLGVFQSVDLPSSSLAGAVTDSAPKEMTQQELNLCMNECMRGCVVELKDEDPCSEVCKAKCET